MGDILSGLTATEAVAAIVGGCAILAIVGFTTGVGKKVARLFG